MSNSRMCANTLRWVSCTLVGGAHAGPAWPEPGQNDPRTTIEPVPLRARSWHPYVLQNRTFFADSDHASLAAIQLPKLRVASSCLVVRFAHTNLFPTRRGFVDFERPPVDLIALLSVRLRRQTGQTMAEYAIVLAVISAAIIGALVLLSGNIESVLSRISSAVK